MKPTDEQRRWQLVLDDPQSPPELRAKAAKHLAIQIPVSGTTRPSWTISLSLTGALRKTKRSSGIPLPKKSITRSRA